MHLEQVKSFVLRIFQCLFHVYFNTAPSNDPSFPIWRLCGDTQIAMLLAPTAAAHDEEDGRADGYGNHTADHHDDNQIGRERLGLFLFVSVT